MRAYSDDGDDESPCGQRHLENLFILLLLGKKNNHTIPPPAAATTVVRWVGAEGYFHNHFYFYYWVPRICAAFDSRFMSICIDHCLFEMCFCVCVSAWAIAVDGGDGDSERDDYFLPLAIRCFIAASRYVILSFHSSSCSILTTTTATVATNIPPSSQLLLLLQDWACVVIIIVWLCRDKENVFVALRPIRPRKMSYIHT